MIPERPESTPPATPAPTSKKRFRPWVAVVLALIVVGGVWGVVALMRGDPNDASSELKQNVIKAVHEQDGTVIKSLVLRHDDKIGDRAGQGYSGTATLASGEPVTVEVWLEHFFNAQGGGDMIHWTLKRVPAAAATSPATNPQ